MNRTPRSPHRRRMIQLGRIALPALPNPSQDAVLAASMIHAAEADVATRIAMKDLEAHMPSFWLSRVDGGSGFRMATLVRQYFQEFAHRLMVAGPSSLPLSFNVVEAFLEFSTKYMVFDVRQEREHLLRLY